MGGIAGALIDVHRLFEVFEGSSPGEATLLPGYTRLSCRGESAGLVLSLAGVGAAHDVLRGPVAPDLISLGASPTIVPPNPDQGLFAMYVSHFLVWVPIACWRERGMKNRGRLLVIGTVTTPGL